MTGKRKRYSADFKAKVALEALKGELTLSQLATKHGVHQMMIAGWRKQAIEGGRQFAAEFGVGHHRLGAAVQVGRPAGVAQPLPGPQHVGQ